MTTFTSKPKLLTSHNTRTNLAE